MNYHLTLNGAPTVGSPRCCDCGKTAAELWSEEELDGMEPDDYARDDGTYSRATNRFCCDICYTARGCPSAPPPRGWKAP